jgi:hypothetical protein
MAFLLLKLALELALLPLSPKETTPGNRDMHYYLLLVVDGYRRQYLTVPESDIIWL